MFIILKTILIGLFSLLGHPKIRNLSRTAGLSDAGNTNLLLKEPTIKT